jgi:hypothetical protein
LSGQVWHRLRRQYRAVIDFTNILRTAFLHIFFRQKTNFNNILSPKKHKRT